jgi:hypothetical protein
MTTDLGIGGHLRAKFSLREWNGAVHVQSPRQAFKDEKNMHREFVSESKRSPLVPFGSKRYGLR